MDCVLCGKDAKYRRVKGEPVCKECTNDLRTIRNHLNSTRKNPKSLLNPSGDLAVTIRDMIIRGKLKLQEEKENKDESLRTSEGT